MTPAQEFTLYNTDRRGWARHVAPRWRDMMLRADAAEKRRLWREAGPELQAELRALAKQEAAA